MARGPDDVWTLSVLVQRARLLLDRASQRWSLLGWNAPGDIATATGIVGEDTVGNLGWKRPEARVALISASSSEVLGVESTTIRGRFGVGRQPVSVLWSITDRGPSAWLTTRLELGCEPFATRGEAALCMAYDGARTRLFEVNPVTRRLNALVSVDGRFVRRGDESQAGWVAGCEVPGYRALAKAHSLKAALALVKKAGWPKARYAGTKKLFGYPRGRSSLVVGARR